MSKRPIKIMQFGEGNFLRAFVDWMIQKANDANVLNHGVVVVQPIDKGMVDMLKAQDCKYHVYLEGIKDKQAVKEITKVDCIEDAINPYRDYEKYMEYALSPDLEIIISNTTEAGIRYEEGEDIFATPPASFPGKVTALLYNRFKKFNGDKSKGLTMIACELIENNGTTLRQYVLKHAEANKLGAEFIAWVNDACIFADTLVDRIVPGFPKENIKEIQAEIGEEDNLVVKAEYYHIWAIAPTKTEKVFPVNKAGLNVLFMDDIKSFRDKKVRVLNGSHTAMVPVGLQMGCQTVMDAFNTPLVEKYINTMVAEEVLPVINEDPQELKAFAAKILERFYNPFIKHYLKDISLNSLSKWETRDYPTVADNYKIGKKAPLASFSLAALFVLYSGKAKVEFTPNDTPEFVQFIQSTFNADHVDQWVEGIINHPKIWTVGLNALPGFTKVVTDDVKLILDKGMEEALKTKLQA